MIDLIGLLNHDAIGSEDSVFVVVIFVSVWRYCGAALDGRRCCVVQQTAFTPQAQYHGTPGLWKDKWVGLGLQVVLRISSDGDDQMGAKIRTPKIPRASKKTPQNPWTKN